jgi:hypothetical protein
MPRYPKKDTPEFLAQFVEAYKNNRCLLTSTSKLMDISSVTVIKYRRQHPEFDEALLEADRLLAERVEGGLVDEALKDGGQIVAKIFYLKNNWREKYAERTEVNIQPGALWFDKKDAIDGETLPKLESPDSIVEEPHDTLAD